MTFDCCFAHHALINSREVIGKSVNALASAIVDFFLQSMRDERIDAQWPSIFRGASVEGLQSRVNSVEKAWREDAGGKMSRVVKLAQPVFPSSSGTVRGLFAYFVDFNRCFVSRECWHGGQRRMKDDPRAPSRSYLKVEEAYGILAKYPQPGETVADLGAAPGGWSYSAAQYGAQVCAIDNGPLKAGARDHSRIKHLREDAFAFHPRRGERYDWFFCDMVEDPFRVLDVLKRWIDHQWCRLFVVNLKFGRTDPCKLLDVVRKTPLIANRCSGVRIRHLYHDRDEFTVAGVVA
jgi:23S rRNA (cytidine2498-2'-O)-methyltransferase